MTLFWTVAVAMIVLALAFVVVPLLRGGRSVTVGRDQLNVAVHRERLAELVADRDEGSLSEEQFAKAKEELERELLQDVAAAPGGRPAISDQGVGRLTAAAVTLMVPVAAIGLYLTLGAPGAVGMHTAADGAKGPSVDEMVTTLEERLKAEPGNAEGWQMLGRSYAAMKRYPQAAEAYAKAYALVGDDPDLLARYAEALALAHDNDLSGEPSALLAKARAKAPDHEHTLWLSGVAAFQAGEFPAAIDYWKRLQAQQKEGSEGYQLVTGYIERAQEQLAGGGPAVESAAAGQGEAAAAPAATAAAGSDADVGLQVQVDLAPVLAAKAAPDATLFIYARASRGPRMPLALISRKASELPLKLRLDDKAGMTPDFKLSSVPEVVVVARISKSGNATPQPGDLEGLSAPVGTRGGNLVQLVIDHEVK